jgi:putative integral membrane protein (TIGR02587 family)
MAYGLRQVDFSPAANWTYAKALGRCFAGAILFSLPILMTMEMWWLGFYLEPHRLLQFLAVNFLILVGLSRVSGFEQTGGWWDDAMDAFAAYAVAALWSALILWLMGIVELRMPLSEIVGKIAIQSVPASFGAMLGGKQFGEGQKSGSERERKTYPGQLFLMAAGAMFVSFSVAPTEEMILISFRMAPIHSIGLLLVSLMLLHAFVYTVGFKGEEKPPGPTSFWSLFVGYSVVGYAIAALVSFYLLWTFGRVEATNATEIVGMVAVLAFPGAIGAALARLVI